jgi:DnaK suppressor protein
MDTFDESMAPRWRELLKRREQQLRAMLQEPGEQEPGGHEVLDFKDIANEESLAAVDEMQAEHAARELKQVLAALARLDSHGYGLCQACGEPIDLQRLAAMPATPLCIACQTRQEQERPPATRR